jgi:hypothetical protein
MRRSWTGPIQIGFVLLIVAGCVALMFVSGPPPATSTMDQSPKARCEARGDWWDAQDQVCAVPVPISTITGHPAKPAK